MITNNFALIGEVIVDFGFILGIFLIVFNLYTKMYNFLIASQTIFMIALLEISLPPNLFRFLQGFKAAHFYQLENWLVPSNSIFSYEVCSSRQHVISLYNDCSFLKIVGHTFNIYLGFIFLIFAMTIMKFILTNWRN